MMNNKRFTDLFICRPVLATVISLLLVILGFQSFNSLTLREYPQLSNALISVTTTYTGAPADVVEGFVTRRLEQSIASAEGIDYMTSTSTTGSSSISVFVKSNYDPNVAFTDIMSKVSQVQNQLPDSAENPVIVKRTGDTTAIMYLSFTSSQMTSEQITDYIVRAVQPKLASIGGVAEAQILGDHQFAMRIWLNIKKMAALGITAQEVTQMLQKNNYQSAPGTTKGDYVQIDLRATTDADNVNTFKNLAIKTVNGTVIRLHDIAKVEMGSQDYNSSVYFNGKPAVGVAIMPIPDANPLVVAKNIRQVMPDIQRSAPPTLQAKIVYDKTVFINASIDEVIHTIIEASIIVTIIIFLFLGSIRTVIVPALTIPLSLIGTCFVMLALGYSLNLLTLLAMVLAIGMVVDDAIVVVENIYRYIQQGMTPFKAAITGTREIALPVISMTITLAAVYAPIGFIGGITGTLFVEFAFTLAGTVILSGLIALTLSPMMCSKVLNKQVGDNRFVHIIDACFDWLKEKYQRGLHAMLQRREIIVTATAVILVSCFFLYSGSRSELAPTEDQGVVIAFGSASQTANIDYTSKYSKAISAIYQKIPSMSDYLIINGFNGVNSVLGLMIQKPWDERSQSQKSAYQIIQNDVNKIPGLKTVAVQPPSLPTRGRGVAISFEIMSIESLKDIYPVAEQVVADAQKSGMFMYVDNGLTFDRPQVLLNVDRKKAADMGITMEDIGQALSSAFGGGYVNWFSITGQSYEVIPQAARQYRFNPHDLTQLHIATASGKLIPLSTIVTVSRAIQASGLTHFQQLNDAEIQAAMAPGYTTSDGVAFFEQEAKKFPQGFTYDFGGQSRTYVQEGSKLLFTFLIAIIIIYLVLAAQFESFRDPIIILLSVPLSTCGALIPVYLGLATINIYTQIGLLTLIGLISKHGILMVEFANQLQEQGLSIREAIEKSASIRLRPILMTTAAMILGVTPLIISTGAGAVSRFDIGLVIASGMAIGTLFTLFVVPTMYTFFAKKHAPLKTADDD